MKLPIDNLVCRIKKITIIMVIVIGTVVFAGPPIYVPTPETKYETKRKKMEYRNNNESDEKRRPPISSVQKTYTENEKILLRYYNEQVVKYGKIDNDYEDNYIYITGRHVPSKYSGILAYVIKDFDNDEKSELAIFRIEVANNDDDIILMNIVLDMVKVVGGQAMNVSSKILLSEYFDGDSLECDIGIKKVNNKYRMYLNYFSLKEIERDYINKYIVVEFSEEINELNNIDLSGNDDIQEYRFEYQDEVIDSGLNVFNDNNIYKKAFIFDDIEIIPIFVIKRINEKIKTGFTEEYVMQHENELKNEMEKEHNIKLRYGYTILVDRTKD